MGKDYEEPSFDPAQVNENGPYAGFIPFRRDYLERISHLPPNALRVLIHLIIKANWKPAIWYDHHHHENVTIGIGETITSYRLLSDHIKRLTYKQVRIAVQHLIDSGYITVLNIGRVDARPYTHVNICEYVTCLTWNNEASLNEGRVRAEQGQTEGRARATIEERKNIRKKEEELTPSLRSGGNGHHPKKKDPRSDSPQIQTYREVMSTYPKKLLYDSVIAAIGESTAEDLRPYATEWMIRGYSPTNLTWLFVWFREKRIPDPERKQQKIGVNHVSDFKDGKF